MVTIIANYNRQMTPDMKAIYTQQLEDQSCFKSLSTNFPNVYAFVLDTLKINLYQEWPQYIWSYKHVTIKDELEHKFFKAAQYILTSYSDKCNRSIQLRTPSERTLWVDRIASIFQTLGDQTGIIGFEWCETLSRSCVDDSINADLWIKTSRRYLDGLGFDKHQNEILSMEASSGLEKEDMEHTMEDTLKNLNSTIAFINGIGRKYLDASFSTFKKLQVFSVQSIKQTITLSSTRVDITKVGYCHIELRKAEIPVTFDEKYKWLRVMELLATLTVLISEQAKIVNILKQEQNGEIYVELRDTVRSNLSL